MIDKRCFHRKVTIEGTPGDDHVVGTPKDDVILTLGGDDVVEGLGGLDKVCTGGGNDLVRWAHGDSVQADLGAGNDQIRAPAWIVDGGPGRDRLVFTGRGMAEINGGPGDDYLRTLHSGVGADPPCVNYHLSPRPVRVSLTRGVEHGEGRDQLVNFHCVTGSHHDDVIWGTPRADHVKSLAGDDVVHTGGGNDGVDAGLGADRVYLGPGRDYGLGGNGWDRVYGGAGADDLEGWFGGDYLEGDAGNDQIYAALYCSHGGSSYDTDGLMDAAGNELFGGTGSDYLVGDKGNDRLDGGPGNDWGMGGYHDGRADWIAATEHLVDSCLRNVTPGKPFHHAG